MARGGRRQGQPGKAYSNRTDLNVQRAPQPGSSASSDVLTEQYAQQAPTAPTPDQIPSLDTPTMQPDMPVTAGVDFGPGPGAADPSQKLDRRHDLLRAALRRDPSNPELRRIASWLAAQEGMDG